LELNNDPVRRYATGRSLVPVCFSYVVSFSYVRRILPRTRPTRLTPTCVTCYNSTVGDHFSCDQLVVRPHAFSFVFLCLHDLSSFRVLLLLRRYVTRGLTVFLTRRMYIINASYDYCRPLVHSPIWILFDDFHAPGAAGVAAFDRLLSTERRHYLRGRTSLTDIDVNIRLSISHSISVVH